MLLFKARILSKLLFQNSYRILFCGMFFLIANTLAGQAKQNEQSKNKTFDDIKFNVDSLNKLGFSLWIREPAESVRLGDEAFKMADKASYSKGGAFAKRVSGVAHWALGEPRLALEDLYIAMDLYDRIDDLEGRANSNLNIGMVYADINEDSTALSYYNKAINEFSTLDLNGRIATTFTKIGSLQLNNGNLEDALNNLLNALKIHTENNFEYGMAEAHNRLGQLYLERKDIEQADYHLRQSLVLSRKINDLDGTISSMIHYGRLQNSQKEYDIAEVHLKWGLEQSTSQNLNKYKLEALSSLANLKKEINQPDSALYYYEWFVNLKDSVFNANKSKQIAALEFKNDLQEKEQELAYVKDKESYSKKIQWILFGGIWIILLLAIFLIKSLKQRNSNQKKLLEQERLIASKQLETQRIKRNSLEQQLELKNKELTSYALNFVQKNDFLNSLQSKILELKTSLNLKENKKLTELERLIKLQHSREKDWDDFRYHFEQVYSSFFINLKSKFPNLSANDLKVAALTRLNLSIKETSNILGISPESTKTARYRLRKKLGLNSEDDLFDFLLSYDDKINK